MDEVKKIVQAVNHKPRNTQSEAHQKFINDLLLKINKLSKKHAYINFEKEIVALKSQLAPN